MKKTKILILGCLAAIAVLVYGIGSGHTVPDASSRLKMKLKKPTGIQQRMIAYNNWNYAMRNDGSYLYRTNESQYGGEFPRGSNYSCVYASGLYVGGLKAGTGGDPDTINVANVEFESEMDPGKILVNDAKDLKYRSYVTPNTGGDATKTAPLGELSAESYQSDEYKVYIIDNNKSGSDWDNWPVYAPRLLTGEPLLLSGAAAQTYAVFHDLNKNNANLDNNLPQLHSPMFGLEMELESFVFTAGLLNNGIFLKLTITNKSDHDYRGAYIGIWSDPDVGSSHNDDKAAVDTNRGLGIVYSDPPANDPAKTALGLDFLQGPVVKVSESSASLVEKFYNHASGAYRKVLKFNPETGLLNAIDLPSDEFRLGATAFIAYPNPNGEPSRLSGDRSRYWYIQGLDGLGNPKPGGPYDEGPDGRTQNDQRIIHGVGPFVMRSGETQDIWMAFVGAQGVVNGAGSGTIYNPQSLSAIQLLQTADDAIQTAFDNALAAPVSPVSPILTATAFDNQVTLTWDNRSENSFDNFGNLMQIDTPTYNYKYREYDFEGYRLYKSLTGLTGSFEQIAEFDLVNGITMENDTLPDARETVRYDVHYGTDNGIQHKYVDEDVVNQRLYYYSLTAYDYQPLFRSTLDKKIAGYPRSLESSLTGKDNLKLIVPMVPPAGISYDGFPVNQLQKVTGTYNNAALNTSVLNPKLLTENRSYTIEVIRFDSIKSPNYKLVGFMPGKLAFRMRDSASGQLVKFDNFTDDPRTYFDTLPGNGEFDRRTGDSIFDDSYYCMTIPYLNVLGNEVPLGANQILPILNGIEIKFMTDTIGIKDFVEVADSSGLLTTPRSVFYKTSPTGHYRVVLIDTHSTVSAMDSSNIFAHGRRLMNQMQPGPFFHDFEFRFLDNAGDTNLVFTMLGSGSNSVLPTGNFNRRDTVPYQVWKVGRRENPADTLTKEQLAVKFLQLNPTTNKFLFNNVIGADTGYSERLIIIDTAYFAANAFGRITPNKIAALNIAIRSYRSALTGPPPGTIIRVETFKSVNHGDKFVYRQVASSPYSKNLAKQTLKNIRVVPNPYYGRVHEYQMTLFDKKVKFTNLPDKCTIRIFNVAGDLIRTITHDNRSFNNRVDKDPLNRLKDITDIDALYTSTEEWDLRNAKGAFVASGMYIALIEAPGIGKQTVKFAVIQEEMRIDGPDNR